MKPQWHVRRSTVESSDAQHRWDGAYQSIMQWSQLTEQTAGTRAALPHSCAVAPDQTVYCSPGWQLDTFYLKQAALRQEGSLVIEGNRRSCKVAKEDASEQPFVTA
jgi:hypothetical protein